MMKKVLPVLALSLFLTVGLAQPEDVTRGYGLDRLVEIGPNSPFWGLDKAVDNAFVDKGNIAHERSSEAYKMVEKNNTQAAQRAIQDMNRVAEQATNKSTKGLQKAQRVLEQVRQRTPAAANLGIDNAIGNINRAQQRKPKGMGPEEVGPNQTGGGQTAPNQTGSPTQGGPGTGGQGS